MTLTLSSGLLCQPCTFDLVIIVTLSVMGGHVTGWPFYQGSESARDTRTPFERSADEMLSRVKNLTVRLEAQGGNISDIGTRLAKVTQSVTFTVAFSGLYISDLKENQTLKFDEVLLNAGDGYSPRTGLFTAPTAGLYAFHIQVTRHPSDPSSCVEVDLVHTVLPSRGQQQQQQQSLPTLSRQPNSGPDIPKEQSRTNLSTQPQSVSVLSHQYRHPMPTSRQITTLLLYVFGDGSNSSQTVVRLARGDTVHAEIRSGRMMLGHAFTSMSGLKLPPLYFLLMPFL
ncbi:hypothetical protein ACOMHN_048907 [Nucella lapillus]